VMETPEQTEKRQVTERAFLEEYKELVRKYGVCVDACGCCQSPFLGSCDQTQVDDHIKHLGKSI